MRTTPRTANSAGAASGLLPAFAARVMARLTGKRFHHRARPSSPPFNLSDTFPSLHPTAFPSNHYPGSHCISGQESSEGYRR